MIKQDSQTAIIRNFAIVAHIDHGKSTLSDRFIELCGGLAKRDMEAQVLDSMDIERERGITIKAQSVTLFYKANNGIEYQLNFIDTPGHVDFSYEVSRSLAACEGVVLIVDAAQGVEAQTVAVCYMAVDQGLTILPVLNKIDLPQADAEKVKKEIEEVIGISAEEAVGVSAKSGEGVKELLEKLVTFMPAPHQKSDQKTDKDDFVQALIIDSWFDNYLGVVSLVRVRSGKLVKGQKIRVMSTEKDYIIDQLGQFTPKRTAKNKLVAGEIGYVVAGIKAIYGAPVGDTLTDAAYPVSQPLKGFRQVKPQVFAGLYTISANDYQAFREALAKLCLNDASLVYEPEQSQALGTGFRCGFLGMLHMEIVQERLEREYGLDLITTAPTVVYQVLTKKGEKFEIDSPSELPETNQIAEIKEPMVTINILSPESYIGAIIQLCTEKRGEQISMAYHGNQMALVYLLPMNEMVLNFFDRLKSISRGYASFDYHFHSFQKSDLVKLDILINGDLVDALAVIVHRQWAMTEGRALALRLKKLIPKQMFAVAIQAAIGSKIIARETVSALRKNVTAKCYGGDISRKRKLLEKQKAGKKRLKRVGRVDIPQDAFLNVLKRDG